jgi:branched-chain amino acid transport system substrate-binding protein
MAKAGRVGWPRALINGTTTAAALVLMLGATPVISRHSGTQTQARVLYVGLTMALTGADAEEATLEAAGALLAIEEANARGGVAGYRIEPIVLNNATPAAGQYDPVQAAANARKLVAHPGVVANIGPENSGAGRAMAPVFSDADLATVSPSTADPDLTAPKMAAVYRPRGRLVYFRTCTTNSYQGPGMANFFIDRLRLKSVFVLDDSGPFGVSLADAFQRHAAKRGVKVLGREQLDPRETDYAADLMKIQTHAPAAIFYGGSAKVGVKLARQAYDLLPNVVKGAGGGMYKSDVLKGAGFPAVEGWFISAVAPHVLDAPQAQGWIDRFVARWGKQPSDYTLTAYDAALVVLDAVRRVAASGQPVNRHTVRDAIQQTHLATLQGVIVFDVNGDLLSRTITIFQIVLDPTYPIDDVRHQYRYIGPAPPG